MYNINKVRRVNEAKNNNDPVRSADKHGLIMIENNEDDETLELIAAELEVRRRKAAGEMKVILSHNIYKELEESKINDDR